MNKYIGEIILAAFFDKHSKDWDKNPSRTQRTIEISKSIKQIVNLTKNSKILDFGCGTGVLGLEFVDMVKEVWFADVSEGMLSEVRNKLKDRNIKNAVTVNIDNNNSLSKFDGVFTIMTLHHIVNVEQQIFKMISWLNKGGYICICDLDKEDGSFHSSDESVPHKGFSREFIINILKKNNINLIFDQNIYTINKEVNQIEKAYPVFMICGKLSN